MPERWPEIVSAAEFAQLRTSADPLEYGRAAHAELSAGAWMELISEYPDMRKWAAHNKTVPIEILSLLASDPDRDVRWMVARKRKLTPEILERLSRDEDEAVRMAVAPHRRTPQHVLVQLRDDPWQEIRRVASARVTA